MRTHEEAVEEAHALLTRSGGEHYFGEAVTKLAHAEQCAWCATQAGAGEELVLAALLHDIGDLLDTAGTWRDERIGVINHGETGASWLAERGFSPRLTALVGGHGDATLPPRTKATFRACRPPAARRCACRGGPMNAGDAERFANDPHLRDKTPPALLGRSRQKSALQCAPS